MKKTLKIITFCLVLALTVPPAAMNAQVFDEGDIVLSFGLGLGSTYYPLGSAYKTTIPPIFVAGDYCLRADLGPGNLGVGGYLGFSGYKWDESFTDYWIKYNTFIIGARGTYHFTDLVDKLDLYGGLLLGAEVVSHRDNFEGIDYYDNYNSSGVAYSLFAGARYFLSDNFAVMGELGYGIAVLSIGVSLKL
jgi:hypothetical protein